MKRLTVPVMLAAICLALAGCGHDPASPGPEDEAGIVRGVVQEGGDNFMIEIDEASHPLGPLQGPFVLFVRNIHYAWGMGALVAELSVLNAGQTVHPEPVSLVFHEFFPDDVTVLDSDNGESGPGAAINFEFADDDGMWTPGEESFPRPVSFRVGPGVAVGFVAEIRLIGIPVNGVISGRAWRDQNQDGVQDEGEPGLEGVTITLENEIPPPSTIPTLIRQTVTGPDGQYAFTQLPAGAYVVGKLPEPGLIPTTPASIHVLLVALDGGVSTFDMAHFGFVVDLSGELVLEAAADAMVRTDLNARRNDNHGCDPFLGIGGSRGGGDIPNGGPDGIRSYVQFSLGWIDQPVTEAILELSLADFRNGENQTYQIDVHRVVDSGPRTPWIEGNGTEVTPIPPGCTWVDAAGGIAWVGAGDGGDFNNQTQPDFAADVAATAFVAQDMTLPGTVVHWNVTQLVNDWITGAAPNHGIVLRDVTSDGVQFKQIWFGSRDGLLRGYGDPRVQPGPRLRLIYGF